MCGPVLLLVLIALIFSIYVTVSFVGLLVTLVIAGVVGWLAYKFVPVKLPYGFLGAVVAGLIGSWIGGWLLGEVGPETRRHRDLPSAGRLPDPRRVQHRRHAHGEVLTAETSCFVCDLVQRRDRAEAPVWDSILRTEHWDLVHSFDASLLGWLVLIARRHIESMADLTVERRRRSVRYCVTFRGAAGSRRLPENVCRPVLGIGGRTRARPRRGTHARFAGRGARAGHLPLPGPPRGGACARGGARSPGA